MLKVMLAFGTRPEAIKMAPLYHHLKNSNSVMPIICLTAQHREMVDWVMDVFDLKPDYDLNLMQPGQDLTDITSKILLSMKPVLREVNPDILLVHGDTTSALACAMAGFYSNIPVGHVEAGLRTFDIHKPFPEEFNRQIISRIATIHFSPTEMSKQNLVLENIEKSTIYVTGNTVIDALFWMLKKIALDKTLESRIYNDLLNHLGLDFQNQKYILITGHRRENFGSGMENICGALKKLSSKYPDVEFIYPVHLNPNVQRPVDQILNGIKNIHLIQPLGYEHFIYLMKHCYLVLTDSGGIQEEAPSLGKPVLVMRESSERPEAIDVGTALLVGTSEEKIFTSVSRLLDSNDAYLGMSMKHNPYGDGHACLEIKRILEESFSLRRKSK